MFENAGSTIKKIAIVYFVICVIASLICAIVYGRTMDGWGDTEFNFLLFLAIFLGGSFVSCLTSLFVYAFGDMTENIKKMAETSAETAKAIKRSVNTAETASGSIPTTALFPANRAAAGNQDNTWVCPKCGSRNKKGNLYCLDCGEYL